MEVTSRVDIIPELMQITGTALARAASKDYCKTAVHIGHQILTSIHTPEAVMPFKCRRVPSCLNIPHT